MIDAGSIGVSSTASRRGSKPCAIKTLLEHIETKEPTEEPKEPRLTDWLNWFSADAVLIGIGFLVGFAVSNL